MKRREGERGRSEGPKKKATLREAMGSSNTGGGGGEKGGPAKAESPAEAGETAAAAAAAFAALESPPGQPAYAEGEKVLAFHGPRIYEAKVSCWLPALYGLLELEIFGKWFSRAEWG